jgi:hypothetical protein
MKIGSLTVLLRDANEFLSLHLIFIVGKVLYKICTQNAVEHWWVSWQSARGSEWNDINRCTVKPDDIFKVRSVAVKCVQFVRDYVIWSFLTYCLEKLRLHTRRPAFYPRPVVAGFLVDKVALWQVFLPVRRFFPHPVNIFPSVLLTLSSEFTLYRGTNGPSLETVQQELCCYWYLGASRQRKAFLFIYSEG